MPIDRFTAFGLAVALLGWIVLVADAALTPLLAVGGQLATMATLRSDVFSVAETTIVSGFALAVIGVLRAGFGMLGRFFEAVMERAGIAAPHHPVAHPPSPPGHAAHPAPATPAPAPPAPATPPQGHAHAGRAPAVTVLEAEIVEVTPPPRPPAAAARKANYVILPNGAVEVDTLLGTRVFASMEEAKDYIRHTG